MRIRFERGGVVLEVQREPMSPERFKAVCALIQAAIGGGILLGAVRLVGFWAIPWGVGALIVVVVYKITKDF